MSPSQSDKTIHGFRSFPALYESEAFIVIGYDFTDHFSLAYDILGS